MTVIVGVRCQNAAVLGADSMATYGTSLGQDTIKQQIAKLYAIGEDLVLGVSGSVGMAQNYNLELVYKVKGTGNRTRYRDVAHAARDLREALWKHAGPSWERAAIAAKTIGQGNAYREVAHDTLIALPVNDTPCLLGFSQQCESVEYDANLPIVSIGSGQPVADPFLAFIRRVFWPNSLPTLSEGVLAAVWALTHTIQSQPAHVGEPIQIVTVSKDGRGQWKAQELPDSDLGEHRENIRAMEDGMRKEVKEAFSEKPTSPLPEKKGK
jgi:20S proteasome alpha/beta subunit